MARGQHQVVLELPPARGDIRDRFGNALALDIRLNSLYAIPRHIKDRQTLVSQLHSLLGIDSAFLRERLSKNKLFVWIARKIPDKTSEKIQKLNHPQLNFIRESKRTHPNGSLASHLLGFTGIDNEGLEGLELYYDSYLKGISGWRYAMRDAKQRVMISKEEQYIEPKEGYHLTLTLDSVIQNIAERELNAAVKKYHAKGGSVILLRPQTGEILALANAPTFDPNEPGKVSPENRRNRAVTDLFEPGSVFKIVTLSACLQEKVINLNDKIFCENGSYRVAGHVLHDHTSHGVLTFQQVIELSSNIGTVKAAARLGREKMYRWVRSFGFGEKTNMGLPGEISGMLSPVSKWSKTTMTAIPMGQEVGVTALQLVQAIAAIANEGVMMRPYIVLQLKDTDGNVVRRFAPQVIRRLYSKETSKKVKWVLTGAVERGTGRLARIPGVSVAGKTGTAQKVLPNGTYSHSQFVASFIGFTPAEDPQLAMVVTLDEPHPIYYGGVAAAPVFAKVAKQTLEYWHARSFKEAAIPESVKVLGVEQPAAQSSLTVNQPAQVR